MLQMLLTVSLHRHQAPESVTTCIASKTVEQRVYSSEVGRQAAFRSSSDVAVVGRADVERHGKTIADSAGESEQAVSWSRARSISAT